MIRSTNLKNENFLYDLDRIQTRMNRAQDQLSSGLRIRQASDAPDQISALLQNRASYAAAAQASSNLASAREEVHASESALDNGIKLLERLRVLAAQAQSGTGTADSRQLILGEVESLMQQLTGVANSTFNGRFLFAGNADQVQPFRLDFAQPAGVVPYAGSAATREVLDAGGYPIPFARSGADIFTSADPAKNVYAAANAFREALISGDSAALSAADGSLAASLTHLNSSLAWYGQTESTLTFSYNQAKDYLLQLTARISGIEESDLAEAVLTLETAETSQHAALQSKAQEDRRTIFDFLR